MNCRFCEKIFRKQYHIREIYKELCIVGNDVKQAQKTILHVKCGNKCAKCKKPLVESGDARAGGECAHIYGENPTSARYDATQDKAFVNSEKNLIYVCPNCHDEIDNKKPHDFPPEILFEMKNAHEAAVDASLQDNIKSGRLFTYLTQVVVRLSSMEMSTKSGPYNRSHLEYEINDKIDCNNIKVYKELIHEYGVYQSYLQNENGLYKISISEGGYEKRKIYNRIRTVYAKIIVELKKEGLYAPYDGDMIFLMGYNKIRELIINSKEYVEMNDDDLMHCLYIVLVDAFIECKWFENPNKGGGILDSSS